MDDILDVMNLHTIAVEHPFDLLFILLSLVFATSAPGSFYDRKRTFIISVGVC